MNEQARYILVGVFVVALAFALVAIVVWLGGGKPGRQYDEYLVYMQESVSGLSRDNVVKYVGVDVGRVHEIGLAPGAAGPVRLVLQIEKGVPVREDTYATLETQGLTGLAYINLMGGSPDSPLLEARPGQRYPEIESRPSTWGRLDVAVEQLLSNLTRLSERVDVLLSEDNQLHLGRTLAQLDRLTAALADRADTLGDSIDDLAATLEQTRAAGEGFPGLVAQLEDAANALERMAERLGASGDAIRRAVEARDREISRFTGQSLPEAAVMIGEMRRAATGLRRFSEQLERDPAVLLRGAPPRQPGPGE
jgi:phospholipid/cholesterol/gamma-HCH transport system substrate-binding protein